MERFQRFAIEGLESVAPLFSPDQRRGIYILEFENGEQYVGQALNVVTRFANHRHGSPHHKPWTDIVAIQFLPVYEDHLTPIELQHIARLRGEGIELRNKVGNFGHLQSSGLDEVISVVDQEHWVLGQGVFGPAKWDFDGVSTNLKLVDKLGTQEQELLSKIIYDLKFALESLVPNAPELESEYWILSDYPSTAGGRFATLNLGVLEFMAFPREPVSGEYFVFINFPEGTFIPQDDWEVNAEFELKEIPGVGIACFEYQLCRTDCMWIPVGKLSETLSADHNLLEAARSMAIELMRQNKSNLFRRWHSRPLVKAVIETDI